MIGFGENIGSGFPLILSAWDEKHWLRPELIEQPELLQVKLTLTIENKEENGSVEKLVERLGKKLGKKLGKNSIAIIKLIVSNPNITYVEIAEALSVSTTTVENRIAEMSGVIIQHVGPKKGGHWETIESSDTI